MVVRIATPLTRFCQRKPHWQSLLVLRIVLHAFKFCPDVRELKCLFQLAWEMTGRNFDTCGTVRPLKGIALFRSRQWKQWQALAKAKSIINFKSLFEIMTATTYAKSILSLLSMLKVIEMDVGELTPKSVANTPDWLWAETEQCPIIALGHTKIFW